jgi:hypothetical protein
MRTTLEIDDEVLAAARSVARAEGKSIGKVISDLARRGLAPRRARRSRDGFPVFDVSDDAAPLTLEMVKRADEE